jgi:EAL domain-containing protein (putative c-di-GMP-specific phosphodiesterase class I)
MYVAKRGGRNGIRIFQANQRGADLNRPKVLTDLEGALDRQEFVLHYQPQVRLAERPNVVGFEALLRWQRDEELVAPAMFIPLLEDLGRIVEVGKWVMRSACEQLTAWRKEYDPDLRMAVNLSPRQFEGPALVKSVQDCLSEFSLSPDALELEITETLLMSDTRHTTQTLNGLKELGIRLAIDDFGTGYSSLSYLSRFSVDTLKIDRAFIRALAVGTDGASITSAIVGLGQRLSLEVVAEGVETRDQALFLLGEGCDVAQGYLFGRPGVGWPSTLEGTLSTETLLVTATA